MATNKFYDENDPVWGTPGRSWNLATQVPAYSPGGLVTSKAKSDEIQQNYRNTRDAFNDARPSKLHKFWNAVTGQPAPPDSGPWQGPDEMTGPNYSATSPNAPAIGANRLSEVGPMYTNKAYGSGRMNRYGMGQQTAPGMTMDMPLGHLAPSRVGIGRSLMGGGMEQRSGGGGFLPPSGSGGRGAIGRVLGGVGDFVSENPKVTAALVGTGADIYTSIQDRREREREREREEERQRQRGRVFGEALNAYGNRGR